MRRHVSTVASRLRVRGLTQAQVSDVIDALAAHVVAETGEGRRVRVPGLGEFRARARMGSTRTLGGETYDVPAALLLVFRASPDVRVLYGNATRRAEQARLGTNDTKPGPEVGPGNNAGLETNQ